MNGPGLPLLVSGARVRLILITHADAAEMLAGRRQQRWHADYPRRDDLDAVSMIRADADPVDSTWGPRHVVHEMQAVGSVGFFGPPVDGEVEVGYGLVEGLRGRGIATEALQALLTETDRLGIRVRASVLPENAPSIRVLAKSGFTDLRGSTEDGELVMARPMPAGRPAP